MKKIVLILSLLLLCSCNKEEVIKKKTIVNESKLTSLEYGQKYLLNDLVSVTDGQILKGDKEIEYSSLGDIIINYEYKDIDSNIIKKSFNIPVVDTTNPIINCSSKYTYKKGKDIDILDNLFCGDNYDRDLKCNLEGNYDNKKVGEYDLKITATDSSNNTTSKDIKLIINNEDSKSSTSTQINIKDIIAKHKTQNTEIGIDVSSWQGDVNWNKAKEDGVEFAMIRIGYGHNSKGEIVVDNYYEKNIKNAKDAGLKVGIYFYSYATNKEDAIKEANWIIKKLNNIKLELPIVFDWESWNSFDNYDLNIYDINNIAEEFNKVVTTAGYEAMKYGSLNYLNTVWKLDNYKTWLAHYTDETSYEKDYYIWQLTNRGKVNGINGNVDLDILYK